MTSPSGQPVLRALIFADLHAIDAFYLAEIDPQHVDVVFTLGDISVSLLDYIIMRAGAIPVIGVPGNHDEAHLPGIINVHRRVEVINGIRIGGFGGARRYKDHPHHYRDWQVSWAMRWMPPVDVFLSHAPPAVTTQQEGPIHRGFSGFDHYIRRHHPKYWLHGHIYRSDQECVGGTKVMCVQERSFLEITLNDSATQPRA